MAAEGSLPVRPDDPGRDWTEPGVYAVGPGWYRIPLPMPADGLRAVNVYAVRVGLGRGEQGTLRIAQEPLTEPWGALVDQLRGGGAATLAKELVADVPVEHDPADWADPDEWFDPPSTVAHHDARLDQSATAVAAGAHTAFEVAQRLRWTRRARPFDDLDVLSRCLAVTETAAHLDVLVGTGRLRRTGVDGVRHYGTDG